MLNQSYPPGSPQLNVAVIDYGMGNIGSIINMLRRLSISGTLVSDPARLHEYDAIILPGVGHFDRAMSNLDALGLSGPIRHLAESKKQLIFGICLGMQLLCNYSEEGSRNGLGLIDADVKRFKFTQAMQLKVPHMGWNTVSRSSPNLLYDKIVSSSSRFYFVHSYYVSCNRQQDILATSTYGIDFVSMVRSNNIFGVQFHPEKSHSHGMRLFEGILKGYHDFK